MTRRAPLVWTVGEPLVALVAEDRRHVEDGAMLRPYVAGSELNVAVGLRRLGVEVVYGTAVGADPFGALVKKAIRAEDITTSFIHDDPERPTGLLIKDWVGPSADPVVHYVRRDSPATQLPLLQWADLMRRSNWVHVSGITPMLSQNNREGLAKIWPTLKGTRSLDINVRWKLGDAQAWRECLERLIPDSTLVFGSGEEFRRLWGCDAALVHDRLHLRPDQVVIGTEGEHGAWINIGGTMKHFPAVPTVVVDPVGASDGLAAGVIAARLWGWEWNQAMRLGSVMGASAVASRGDYEGYLYRDQAMAWVAGKWVSR